MVFIHVLKVQGAFNNIGLDIPPTYLEITEWAVVVPNLHPWGLVKNLWVQGQVTFTQSNITSRVNTVSLLWLLPPPPSLATTLLKIGNSVSHPRGYCLSYTAGTTCPDISHLRTKDNVITTLFFSLPSCLPQMWTWMDDDDVLALHVYCIEKATCGWLLMTRIPRSCRTWVDSWFRDDLGWVG